MADSLSIFAEGTFEEQVRAAANAVISLLTYTPKIQELVKYLARPETDEARATFIRPFQDALFTPEGEASLADDEEKRRKVLKLVLAQIKGLGEGSDRGTVIISNFQGRLTYSSSRNRGILQPGLCPSSCAISPRLSRVDTISDISAGCHNVLSADGTNARQIPHVSLWSLSRHLTLSRSFSLSNLFNALPNRSTLRPRVYKTLLDLATENSELEVLQIKTSDVEKWLDEWDVSADEKSEILKSISEAFAKVGQECVHFFSIALRSVYTHSLIHREASYTYLILYVRSIPPNSPKAKTAALDLIATSLRLPSVFNFDPLLKIDAVRVAKDHQLFALFKILLEGGLLEYRSWLQNNEAVLNSFGMSSSGPSNRAHLSSAL